MFTAGRKIFTGVRKFRSGEAVIGIIFNVNIACLEAYSKSPSSLYPWIGVQFSLLQDSGYLSNLLRVTHVCHLPLLLLLPDPGLLAGLPAGLEATEEGQDLGLDCIFIS